MVPIYIKNIFHLCEKNYHHISLDFCYTYRGEPIRMFFNLTFIGEGIKPAPFPLVEILTYYSKRDLGKSTLYYYDGKSCQLEHLQRKNGQL